MLPKVSDTDLDHSGIKSFLDIFHSPQSCRVASGVPSHRQAQLCSEGLRTCPQVKTTMPSVISSIIMPSELSVQNNVYFIMSLSVMMGSGKKQCVFIPPHQWRSCMISSGWRSPVSKSVACQRAFRVSCHCELK